MVEWIFILLLGIVIGYLVRSELEKRQLLSIKHQIEQLRQIQSQYGKIRLSSVHSSYGELLSELNQLIENYQLMLADQRQQDQKLRNDLANISHDLRTPLTAIMGYLELLQDASSPSEEKRYLAIILDRTHTLQHLIQELFYLVRLENEVISFEYETIDLNSVISENLAGFYEQLKEKYETIDVDLSATEFIVSDKQATERIIHNLIRNIIDHGRECAGVATSSVDGQTILEVRNRVGWGEQIDIDKVFDRHYSGYTERKQENTGLGLAIVYELCKQLGHQVQVNIENDEFIIRIIF